MNIRKATREDYASLMKLYNEFVGEERYSNHDNDSFIQALKNTNNFVFIAEDNGKLIGFATFTKRIVIRYPKPIAELDELYVVPNMRKKGIGKLLMKKVIEQAKHEKCHRLYIETHFDRKEAHSFYESLKFTQYGYHFIKNL